VDSSVNEERGTLKMTASSALRHPMRIRILEVLYERDMSPVEFMNLGLAPKVESAENTLSHVSYHFRQLAEDGCLEVVKRVPRRGATEHVYRARVAHLFFSDEEWEQLTMDQRRFISRGAYQGLAALTDGAMLTGTFDSRHDRHLSWDTMDVDERGWKELMEALADCLENVERIRGEAEDRLACSDEDGIPVTIGLLGFESPDLPCRDQATMERPVIASG
jgi:hypothetical protein